MKLKCTRITQTMTSDCKRDDDGKPEMVGARYVYVSMPRWDIVFEIAGGSRALSGSFSLHTTCKEQAERYKLHGVYEFSELEESPVT